MLRLIRTTQTAIALLAATIIVASTVADVVLRYGFGHPIHGSYDIVETLLVVLVFHGMPAVFHTRGNITIDLIDHMVSLGARVALIRASDIISVAALLLVIWAMIAPALQAYDYGDRKLELGLKLWIIWVAAISGLAGTAITAIARAVSDPT